MFNEMDRLHHSPPLLELLAHYAELAAPNRQVWQDRLMAREGCSAREMTGLHCELIAYGYSVFKGWLMRGEVHQKAAKVGPSGVRGLSRVPRDLKLPEDDAHELAVALLEVALRRFLVTLRNGQWDPSRKAGLRTFFVGRCLMELPDVHEKWARERKRWTQDVVELMHYFEPVERFDNHTVHAVPGYGLNVPIYLLGSSDFSAQLAAELGLPFAFASHFAPEYLHVAIELYRSTFKPSKQLEKPYVIVGCNVVAADSDDEAKRLWTTHQQSWLGIIRGARGLVPPPVDSIEPLWNEAEKEHITRSLRVSRIGLRAFESRTEPNSETSPRLAPPALDGTSQRSCVTSATVCAAEDIGLRDG